MPSNLFDNPAFFRTALEELPVGIYVIDRDQRIRFWNQHAEHIMGYLAHEVVDGNTPSTSLAIDTGTHCVTVTVR